MSYDPRTGDITPLLRAQLRESLVEELAGRASDEEIDRVVDELMALAKQRGREIRESRGDPDVPV